MTNVTMAQVEVKKVVFVTIEGVEKRAKVLSKGEETLMVQLYDGNKLQKNADSTAIKTEIKLESVSLEKTAKTASKTNVYEVVIKNVVIEATETNEVEGELVDAEDVIIDKVLLTDASNKDATNIFKTYESELIDTEDTITDEEILTASEDGLSITLVKIFDAKGHSSERVEMKSRVIGEAVVAKAKAVKAVYGLKIQKVDAETAEMVENDLSRKEALEAYKEAKTSGVVGDKVTMITISDTTGKVVNKDTYPTFIVGSDIKAKKTNHWGVTKNGEVIIKDKSYNETRKDFTALKKDETLEVGTKIEMLKLIDTEGVEVMEMKYTYTVEIPEQNIEPQPVDVIKAETETENVTETETETETFDFELESGELENEIAAA